MKFTLNWLKTYLETSASLDEISETLTAIGLEVESITDPAAALADFTVAQVAEAEKHPNADRLKVCKVNTGSATLQIVCGAPNARAGIKVALAKEGVIIPNGEFKIKKSKIRDVESNGMLCSAQELNLGEDHAGIIELPEDATLGAPIADALGLNDAVIDIAITPNRGDCLGVYGIARDLAAAGLGTLKDIHSPSGGVQSSEDGLGGGQTAPSITPTESADASCSSVSQSHPPEGELIRIEDSGCTQFTYATIHNVKNGESPEWLKQRLTAIGLRPISALVDVTNYISVDLCRPLHVYDLDKLQGGIAVREGKAGEKFDALNDKEITLQGGEIAITDGSGVIGLGGIIGGTSTGCDENTKNVLLEVAWFDPIRIAKTGRKLGVESDARYRFERSVDPEFLPQGAAIALNMITELCGGETSAIETTGQPVDWKNPITFDADKINQRTGLQVNAAKQKEILQSLGFTFEGDKAVPPSWRADVEGIADISEEVARMVGYDDIPVLPLAKPAYPTQPRSALQERIVAIKQILAENGLRETVNWSFMSSELAPQFGGAPESLKLVNPISSELDQMRPSLLPHLIEASQRNADRGLTHSKLFEAGLQYHGIGENDQTWMASGVLAPQYQTKDIRGHARKSDVFDAKAAIEAAISAAGFDASRLQLSDDAPEWYHPGKSGSYKLGKQIIAQFGEIHPRVLKQMDVEEGVVGFEIFVAAIPFAKKKTAARPAYVVSEYQAVTRDFAFVVNENIAAGEVIRATQKADDTLIQKVELFDVYQGKGLEEDEKSLAISITLQAQDRTLTDKEIEQVSDKVISNAAQAGAKLRG